MGEATSLSGKFGKKGELTNLGGGKSVGKKSRTVVKKVGEEQHDCHAPFRLFRKGEGGKVFAKWASVDSKQLWRSACPESRVG